MSDGRRVRNGEGSHTVVRSVCFVQLLSEELSSLHWSILKLMYQTECDSNKKKESVPDNGSFISYKVNIFEISCMLSK